MAYKPEPGGGTRKAQNINLSAEDLERLLNGSRAIVRGLGGDPSGIKSRSRLPMGDQLSLQRQMERDSFPGVPAGTPQMPQPSGSNNIQAILAQLQKLMSGNGNNMPTFQPMQMPQFDPNRYKKQAEESVNAQFNPIINQLMAQQGQTQQRARQNRVSVRDLYAGAVNDINTGSAAGQKGYDAAQAQSQKLYADERNRIAAGYAADAAAQRAEAKRLGTEALGVNEAIGEQNADKQFADQMQSQQMLSSNQAFEQQQQAAGQYDRSIANATQAEGIESQEDIMRQLEDYMSQSNSDLANTRAQQAGSISDLMMQLANAGYERDSQNQQFQYQQQRDYIGDQQNMMKMQQDQLMAQLEAAAGGQGDEKLNPWQQIATFAEQLQPGQGSTLVSAIQKAMNERGEIYARSKDETPMNPALFAKLIADYPENSGLDRNTLMMLSQELYRLMYGMG
jgi:hypothetical protein